MGDVYGGRHLQTGVDVAVKMMRRTEREDARRMFRREVQAHARLVHPHVVYLFEYGEVGAQVARASDGRLDAHDPYVAMELASRGTVRDLIPFTDWASVRQIVLQVLDGLAFAHARGVVHRDLKPENLLVCDGGIVKLADFGIAHVWGAELGRDARSLGAFAGTPYYSAPEQIEGRWRDYGPWTDLYALGCMLWELVCGRPPFVGESMMRDVIMCHLQAERPPLRPRFEVPPGLDEWIRTAMAVDSRHRFERAADAAFALPLARHPCSEDEGEPSPALRVPLNPTLEATLPAESTQLAATFPLSEARTESFQGSSPQSVADGTPSRHPQPPTPVNWCVQQAGVPTALLGAGLGLFGLREPPFVDRDALRDQLWTALREVDADKSTKVVLLTGDSGSGKSAAVEWIATRAHEVGAATIFRAVHSHGGTGARDGFAGMIREVSRSWGLPRGQLFERLRHLLGSLTGAGGSPEMDARGLTELVFPSQDGPEIVEPRYRFSGPAERHALLGRAIARLSGGRTSLIWIDDAQWNPDSLEFIEHLLRDPDARCLILATLRTDVLAADPELNSRVDDLLGRERCDRVVVSQLPDEDHRALIDRLLPLHDELASLLAHRTEGNPLFAVQLLGDRVERGQLEASPGGFRLADGIELDLPDDVHELWMARLERLFDDLPALDRQLAWQAVELAACLGRVVDSQEWADVCEAIGLRDGTAALADRLVERGLARRAPEGWAFAHVLLVDSVERHAREKHRLGDHHRRCADALEQLHPDNRVSTAERRAEHWIAAGELEHALEPLATLARWLNRRGESMRARAVSLRHLEVLNRLGTADDDVQRRRIRTQLAWLDAYVGAPPTQMVDVAHSILVDSLDPEEAEINSSAWRLAAFGHGLMGEDDEARRCTEAALETAQSGTNPAVLAGALVDVGWQAFLGGDLEVAIEHFSRARSVARGHPDAVPWQLLAARNLATVLMSMDPSSTEAEELLNCALDESRVLGFRGVEIPTLNALGELERRRGNFERARAWYEACAGLAAESTSPDQEGIARYNLALCELQEGRFPQAHAQLAAAADLRERIRATAAYETQARLAALVLAAGTRRWTQFDELAAPLDAAWAQEARLRGDEPLLLELAGHYTDEAGDSERARRAWTLARQLWARRGDEPAVERLDRLCRVDDS